MNNERIFKYPLAYGENRIPLPEGASVILFAMQQTERSPDFEVPMLWIKLDTFAPKTELRCFRYFPTGIDIPGYGEPKHLGSAMTSNGQLVWHLFEFPMDVIT